MVRANAPSRRAFMTVVLKASGLIFINSLVFFVAAYNDELF